MRALIAFDMSAIGPKRTSLVAPHMSAFEGKADMAFPHSAFDPRKRPFAVTLSPLNWGDSLEEIFVFRVQRGLNGGLDSLLGANWEAMARLRIALTYSFASLSMF
jgi:hypothetical protein